MVQSPGSLVWAKVVRSPRVRCGAQIVTVLVEWRQNWLCVQGLGASKREGLAFAGGEVVLWLLAKLVVLFTVLDHLSSDPLSEIGVVDKAQVDLWLRSLAEQIFYVIHTD